MGKIDKTYERALNTYEMSADQMPSKSQKKQKTKMRQKGKSEVRSALEDMFHQHTTTKTFYTGTPDREEE